MPRVQEAAELDLQCSLIYGVTGSGKTRICATWPRVAWIGSARELGWKTIKNMNPADFYEPNRPPLTFKVLTIDELANDLLHEIFPRVQTGEVRTICLELSFYADDVIRGVKTRDGWEKYRTLEDHIAAIDERVKSIPSLRVVYNALSSPGIDEKHPSGLQIAGKAVAAKVPAMCDLLGYLRAEDIGNNKVERILHMVPYGTFPARQRYDTKLPPLLRNPTFRKLERLLRGEVTVDDNGNLIEQPRKLTSLPPLIKGA